MRVLTWNLFHGRAHPAGAGRSLLAEFGAALAGWRWDVALLQEVPPWWPPALAAAAGAEQRTVLTSRNELLRVRRWAADRRPDLVKSAGGGANAILVRGRIRDHAAWRLRRWPERRAAHAVRLDGPLVVTNLHASKSDRSPERDLARAAACAGAWAGGAPVILGGDFNDRAPAVAGFVHAASRDVDHILARGLEAAGGERSPERPGAPGGGMLSDHPPLTVTLRATCAAGCLGRRALRA
jgi:endonuclease/exonuclease/phosphatase family metal-dependent hydrolase